MNYNNISGEIAFSAKQFTKEREYWLKKLSGDLEKTSFPYDSPKSYGNEGKTKGKQVETVKFEFPAQLCERLLKTINKSDSRLHMILVAGLVILLYKYTGCHDIILGTSIDKQETTGTFINTILALRNQIEDGMTFKELLMQVRQSVLEAKENMNYPLETIPHELEINVTEGEFSLFDTIILLENIHEKSYIQHIDTSMVFTFVRKDQSIQGTVEYSPQVYYRSTVERIVLHYRFLLLQALMNVNAKLSEIEILTIEEKRNFLVELNNTNAKYPEDKTIVDLFEEQVVKTPQNTAVEYENQQLTYLELDKRADDLTHILRQKGIITGKVVAIVGERNIEIVVGILGILKTGGVYLPIDGQNPDERIKFILNDGGARVLLSQRPVVERKSGCFTHFPPGNIVLLDQLFSDIGGDINTGQKNPPESPVKLEDAAYIIYTSGSTGKPKGVVVQHRSLVNYIWWAAKVYIKNQPVNFPFYTSIAFDLTITSIFTPLVTGNAIVIYGGWDKELLVERIMDDRKVGIIKITPSHLKLIRHKRNWKPTNDKDGASNSRIKRFIVGGEELDAELAADIYRNFNGDIEIYNEYGPTEATVGCMIYKYESQKGNGRSVPIGIPADNTQIYILDDKQNLVPWNGIGEIYVSGEGVARGYLHMPGLTGEKFIPNPFTPGKKMYRTGDRARRLQDGNIEFLGRRDEQVKIRGFRVELGEIENRLLRYDGIEDAVTIVKRDESGEDYLCSYIVSNRDIGLSELREYLLVDLPDYMVPLYFTRINKIPLTPNGKINTKALPEPEIGGEEEYVAPRDEIEKKLVEMWAEILGIPQEDIGIDDNYFEMGGHSLKATVLASRIHKELNTKLTLVTIFRIPTVRGLAEYLRDSKVETFTSIEPVEKKTYYALSPSQKRLFVLQQIEEKNNIAYNIPLVEELVGKLDSKKFELTFRKLIQRHEGLRTSFKLAGDEPVQTVHNHVDFEVEYCDLNHWETINERNTRKNKEYRIEEMIRDFIQPFDLSQAPLLRVRVMQTAEYNHLLMVDIHHIVTDGLSMSLFIRDFISLYGEKELPELRIQYKDYSQWLNSEKEKESIKKEEKYWLNRFEGEIPLLQLPTDYLRPAMQGFEGDLINFEIPGADVIALKRMADEEDVTFYMLLLSLFNILLSNIGGQEDIIVGTPIAGRRHADLQDIIGVFINTLVMRNSPSSDKSFKTFLKEVKKNTLEAYDNQAYPFEDMVGKLEVNRDASRNPIFDVMFEYESREEFADRWEIELPELTFKHLTRNTGISKFDMSLRCLERGEKLYFVFEFSSRLFKKRSIERFINYFKKLISSVLENPSKKLLRIDIISEEEKKEILFDFNNTETDFPTNKVIHEFFEEQVEKIPDHIALVGVKNNRSLTYKEVNERANRLAKILRMGGVKPETLVGIMVTRSIEMVIAVLGVMKSGGAYLPIDPTYPDSRIKYLIDDSGMKILMILTQDRVNDVGHFAENEPEIIKLDGEEIYKGNVENLEIINKPRDLAYVIYTSGTTGNPKGVMIEQMGVVNILNALQKLYPFTQTDAFMLKTSFTFDVSVTELFGWFWGGGRLVIPGVEDERNPLELLEIIENTGVTHINFIPSMFNAMEDLLDHQNIKKLTSLKYIFLAGEPVLPALVNKYRRFPIDIPLENLYGPTEATIYASWYSLSQWDGECRISIGKPVPNTRIYIVDRDNRLQPTGVVGELCIAGDGVARGYLGREKLTAEKFLENPYGSGERMYRTGDLARWMPDGNIECLGRMDHQVKIRGYRIELGEIESKLLMHQEIKEAVVLTLERPTGPEENHGDIHIHRHLCAYIAADAKLEISDLKMYLAEELPQYMIPSFFVFLDELPLTANGKLDRKSLPEPEITAYKGDIAPGDEIEAKIAEVWAEVLGINKTELTIDRNFFELGGDSINAIQVSAKLLKYQLNVKSSDLFLYPTIRALRKCVSPTTHIISQGIVEGDVELTPIQQWFFGSHFTNSHHFNQSLMLYKDDEFDEEIVVEVFKKIVEHHDALRMIFIREGGRIIQRNRGIEGALFDLQVKNFKDKTDGDIQGEIKRESTRVQGEMNLETGPLVKLMLFHTTSGSHLLMAVHHLVIDAVSWRIILEDFANGYRQVEKGEAVQLPAKTDSFKYWASGLKGYAATQDMLEEIMYWKGLNENAIHPLPKDEEVKKEKRKRKYTETLHMDLERDETEKLLKEANKAYNTEINDLLLTALGLAVREWAGINHVLIGLEGHGREEILDNVNISRTVGWITSLYPAVLDVSDGPGNGEKHEISESDESGQLGSKIKRIKETLRNIPNKGISYGILKYLVPNKVVGFPFDLEPEIIFNYLGHFREEPSKGDDEFIKLSPMSTGIEISPEAETNVTLNISGLISGGQLHLSFEYNKHQYERSHVEELTNVYKLNLLKIINHCVTKEVTEMTLSDFTTSRLKEEELTAIYGDFED